MTTKVCEPWCHSVPSDGTLHGFAGSDGRHWWDYCSAACRDARRPLHPAPAVGETLTLSQACEAIAQGKAIEWADDDANNWAPLTDMTDVGQFGNLTTARFRPAPAPVSRVREVSRDECFKRGLDVICLSEVVSRAVGERLVREVLERLRKRPGLLTHPPNIADELEREYLGEGGGK
jgi:hypothetical protein